MTDYVRNPYTNYTKIRNLYKRGGEGAPSAQEVTRARREAAAWLKTQPWSSNYDYDSVYGKNNTVEQTLPGYKPPNQPPANPPPANDPNNPPPPGGNPPPGTNNPPPGNSNVTQTLPEFKFPDPNANGGKGWISGDNTLANSIAESATGGVLNDFNTSANRLRERLDAARAGDLEAVQQRNVGRGFGASGINNADEMRVRLGSQYAYGQGLSALSDAFEQNRIKGLGIANDANSNILARDKAGADIISDVFRSIYNANVNKEIGKYSSDSSTLENFLRQIADLIKGGGNSSGGSGGSSGGQGGGGYNPNPGGSSGV